jgi:hypothetical protein
VNVVLRKSVNSAAQRRDLLLSERNRSATLRRAYPDVARLGIELIFRDPGSDHTPSPQRHTLYPAAPAFFRFACPCADCDADFDLMPVVAKLLDGASGQKRALTASGQMSCHGVRLRDRAGSNACSMQLKFQLVAAPANNGD